MPNHKRERTTMKLTTMMIPLALTAWISPAISFPNTQPQIITGTISFVDRRSLSQRYAFGWFGKDDEKGEEDPDGTTDSQALEDLSKATNIMESFKTSQRIGERSGRVLEELQYTMVEGTSADGKIKVNFNGQQIPVGVDIDESYLAEISSLGKEGTDALCKALTLAMQDAHYKSGVIVEEKMKSLYTDLEFDSD